MNDGTQPIAPDANGRVVYRLAPRLGVTAKTQNWVRPGEFNEMSTSNQGNDNNFEDYGDEEGGQEPKGGIDPEMTFQYSDKFDANFMRIHNLLEKQGRLEYQG